VAGINVATEILEHIKRTMAEKGITRQPIDVDSVPIQEDHVNMALEPEANPPTGAAAALD